MKPQPLLYLREPEKFERPMAEYPESAREGFDFRWLLVWVLVGLALWIAAFHGVSRVMDWIGV